MDLYINSPSGKSVQKTNKPGVGLIIDSLCVFVILGNKIPWVVLATSIIADKVWGKLPTLTLLDV